MKNVDARQVLRVACLTALATLMVAGFLVMGGLGSGDSAEARCSTRWFDRCPDYSTLTTEDLAITTTSAAPPTETSTSTSTGGFLNCAKRWFNRCHETTTTADVSGTGGGGGGAFPFLGGLFGNGGAGGAGGN